MRTRRLLLIAMSGVRVRSEELRRLGMTLPGFIERGRVVASLPSLGLLTLAAHTPPHWEVEYHECDDERDLAGRWDVVAISSLSARIHEAYGLADRLRADGTKVVLGGLHVSALPDEAEPHADAVVVGQGEAVWEELLSDLEAGRLRRRYGPRPFSLTRARVPRYDLLDIRRYNRLTIQTARGCPLDCTFCGASRLLSAFQVKPAAQIRRELEAVLARWPRPFIELADDNTFAHKRHAHAVARLLGEYPVRWFTETDISIADDDALLEELAESGCAQLLIGFESTRRASLHDLDSRRWKYDRHPRTINAIRKIQSYGISVNGCFVLGFDEDDPGIFEETRDFVRESGLSQVQITIRTPFPGTALYRQLAAEGRLLSPAAWDRCTLFDVMFEPKRMSVRELEEGFRSLMSALYEARETARRKALFRRCVRARRDAGRSGG
ncbi:MAG: B12-binding domain-containing radical SAM protein [Planctomycetes bacterium]|nr:B12-binding domain-containing radical SAM protein [Planctomycetota bacterium]